jgi:hypothetical protein
MRKGVRMGRMVRSVLILMVLGLGAPPGGAAEGSAALRAEAATKIAVSGRQRMLTQMLAKSVCMGHMQVDPAASLAKAKATLEELEHVQAALRLGDATLGLTPEGSAAVVPALAAVDETWGDYRTLVETEIGSPGDEALRALYQATPPLVARQNAAVSAFEAQYADHGLPPDLAATVNLAGRQRMLTQKAALIACYIGAGLATYEDRAALGATLDLFETSLRQLRTGDPKAKILVPPIWEVEASLDLVETEWQPVAVLLRATLQSPPDAEALRQILAGTDRVLKQAEETVALYQML